MKIILLRPPYICGKISFINSQFPLNIAYLASYLKKHNFQDVEIWDYEIEEYNDTKFFKRLLFSKPDLIGISCLTPTISYGHRIAAVIKKSKPKIVTVVGGFHASALPRETLKNFTDFDYLVFGEGEKVFLKLCQLLNENRSVENLQGLAYRKNGVIIKNAAFELIDDLDSLPFPAREMLKINAYRGQSFRGFSRDFLRITEILTSRGCPHACIFCSSNLVHGQKIRFRSANNVLAEMEDCIKRYNFNHFCFLDDNFTINENRLEKLCEGFRKLKVTWNCLGYVNNVSKEMLKMMKDAGCQGISFGIESGSQHIQNIIKKGITVEQVINSFKWAREVGIKIIEADFMIGSHPSENIEDIEKSIKLIKKIQPDILAMSIAVPNPGTTLYQIMKEKDYIREDWKNFLFFGGIPAWRTEHFSPDELMKIQKKIIRKFYLNPTNIWKRMRKIESIKELYYYLKIGVGILNKI